MTKEELKELENRHFAPSTNMTWYFVCRECDKPCVFTEEEGGHEIDFCSECGVIGCFEEVYSPLSKDDFQKLAKEKADDEDFWTKTVLREDEDDDDDDD